MKTIVAPAKIMRDLTKILFDRPLFFTDDNEYIDYVPFDRPVHLAIGDDPVALYSIPAEQKIIIGHPAPPNSNWYSVDDLYQIIEMLEFDKYLTINNITIGVVTYAS